MKIPKIEYDVYSKLHGTNLTKLNATICKNTKITLSIPVIINEAIDKLNSSSGYFNNICYKSTSNYGTDISLKDRREDFINKNQTVCQDDCDFINYNFTTQKANCSCKFKFSSFSFADIHINKTKLFENFKNISNIANLNILKCHKQLFKKESILYNIGFYFTTAIIIFHIITCFIFYLKQYKEIRDKIKDIIFAIKYLKLNKSKKWIRKNELDENNEQEKDEKNRHNVRRNK